MEKPKSPHVLSALIGNWGPIGKVSTVEPKEELDDYFYYLPKEIIVIKKIAFAFWTSFGKISGLYKMPCSCDSLGSREPEGLLAIGRFSCTVRAGK